MPPRWLPGEWATPAELLATQAAILHRLDQMEQRFMSVTAAQFEELRQLFEAETTRIGDYILKLLEVQQRDDLTAEQEAAVLAGFQAVAERLKQTGVVPTAPIVDTPLPEIPA